MATPFGCPALVSNTGEGGVYHGAWQPEATRQEVGAPPVGAQDHASCHRREGRWAGCAPTLGPKGLDLASQHPSRSPEGHNGACPPWPPSEHRLASPGLPHEEGARKG